MIIRKIERRQTEKRVAAYARVSTLSEAQEESFETQKSYYAQFIHQVPTWRFVNIYSDQGITGTSADKRPGFLRMIADAKAGLIDLILCKSVSRFSRNFAETQHYVHLLKSIGVEVRFEKESISSFNANSDLLFSTMAAISQEESRSISENVKWAYKKLAEKGIRHLGNNRILGYDEIGGKLVPNKDAWIVQLIFDRFVEGKSLSSILDELKASNAQTLRKTGDFNYGQIMCILKNNTYTGNRQIQKGPHQNYLTKKPDRLQPYTSKFILNDHIAIVPEDVWKVAQARIRKEEELRKRRITTRAGTHPFYGRVICGECGRPYRRFTYKERSGALSKVWKCSGRADGTCSNRIIKEAEVASALKEANTYRVTPIDTAI